VIKHAQTLDLQVHPAPGPSRHALLVVMPVPVPKGRSQCQPTGLPDDIPSAAPLFGSSRHSWSKSRQKHGTCPKEEGGCRGSRASNAPGKNQTKDDSAQRRGRPCPPRLGRGPGSFGGSWSPTSSFWVGVWGAQTLSLMVLHHRPSLLWVNNGPPLHSSFLPVLTRA